MEKSCLSCLNCCVAEDLSGKRILIIHFRVGKTDGVSLQIAAWKEILTRLGAEVVLVAGDQSIGADHVVDHLENQLDPLVYELDEEAFGGFKKMGEEEWQEKFENHQRSLKANLARIFGQVKPDRVIISNIFSVGENLAVAGALTEILAQTRIRSVAVNHDFYWENQRYNQPSCQLVKDQLDRYFPPRLPNLSHCCISSLAQEQLKKRKGIESIINCDTVDFEGEPGWKKEACQRLLKLGGLEEGDLLVLQATRIVRRKNIELSIEITKRLSQKLGKTTLYDGRKFDPVRNRVVLVMAGYAEKRDRAYQDQLLALAEAARINLIKMNTVGGYKSADPNQCTLLDVHAFADIVTYPSQYEGFGNQFLEATYARRPVIIFEYPVFRADIAPKGFEVISLGEEISFDDRGLARIPDETMDRAVAEAVAILTDGERYRQLVEKNFRLAAQNYSYQNTAKIWLELLAD